METAGQFLRQTKQQIWTWSWLKKGLLLLSLLTFGTSSFLYLTPPGAGIREFLASTVITTQHRSWAWIFVGAEKRDEMVKQVHDYIERASLIKQNLSLIKHKPKRTLESLIKVEEISGKLWKGKLMYIYDPTTIRVVVPAKPGEGERISSMAQRTGAVAGINGGGFIDPDGLGNGFAPIGVIMSGYRVLYNDVEEDTSQPIVGFTKEGTLLVGKYSVKELWDLKVRDAVSFAAPRLIANGQGMIVNGDGGWGRAPRTAVAQKEDGTLMFVIIDGRQAYSVGATLKEVQDLLLERGAINAGLLDGGASSELVINGEVVTKPSSRWGERRLPSGLLVFDNPDDIVVNSVWEGLSKIDPGGRYDHPDFLREMAEKRARETQLKKTAPPAETNNQAKNGEEAKKPTDPKAKPGENKKPSPTDSKSKPSGSVAPSGTNPASHPAGTTAPGGTTTSTGSNGSSTSPAPGVPSPGNPAPGTILKPNTTTTPNPAGTSPATASPPASGSGGTANSGSTAPATSTKLPATP